MDGPANFYSFIFPHFKSKRLTVDIESIESGVLDLGFIIGFIVGSDRSFTRFPRIQNTTLTTKYRLHSDLTRWLGQKKSKIDIQGVTWHEISAAHLTLEPFVLL